MKKLFSIFAAMAALFILTPAAAAPGWTQYSASTFESAQKAGKTIVVDVHAEWCPTCRAQQPILSELQSDKRFKDVVFIKVNFDDDKAFLRAHRVPRQSTILVFKGRTETGRSIAETNRGRLRTAIINAI